MQESLKFIAWPTIAGILAALLILDRWVLPASDATAPGQAVSSYANAVEDASPSVVNIYTAKRILERAPLLDRRSALVLAPSQSVRERIERSLGSGVIMTAQGHILTNHHVIAGADAIQVLLHDGRTANAAVVGSDIATDLAVLRIDLPDLKPISTGNSNRLQVGDVVLAIGNPLGFGHTVSQGIVSALGRWGLQPNAAYEDYIQTDASVHQGNSGGALIDARGQLMGINTLIYTSGGDSEGTTGIGISLAIPINMAAFVMHDLIEYGEVIRGWLGVSVDPIRPVQGEGQALLVMDVAASSPAERAGLAQGDVITHINGDPILDGRQTMHHIAQLRPGDTIAISIRRRQQSLELRAVVGVQGQTSPVR
ncbi:protease [Halioglobus japonicus]|uniref:PDZ domain-containing protein n=2 Tax=Halioglobus TaxID=1217416 RepID=A0AAP8MFX3_9GAMM|nr:trypsin-like peptidase domain-containing protein [Halioglobus japonicus]AQA19797.1 protease [Halioglobus japonicus]PLW87131.1 PDZ domain-containing protein [Halioglobus japonicus]GHD10056.1 2-alkenal reductase [Halioglobus japonicus]